MADSLSREERIAAGLKKLRNFQQKGKKSKKPSSKETSPINCAEDLEVDQPNYNQRKEESLKHPEIQVPAQNTFISASQENLKSASESEHQLQKDRGSTEQLTKSKSDLDLSQSKELSSTESLLQISEQINGLMSETHALLNGSIEQEDSPPPSESHSLERRNQELASKVDSLRQSNDHLQFQIREIKAKNTRLLREFEQEKQDLLEKSRKEQVTLKDQLQVHIQTIGILVAEKTELQSSLSLSQQAAKQKAAEAEEFQGRLRASRQRANDLERELNNVNTSNQQFEKGSKESLKEIDRLKMDNYKLSKSVEEYKQQCTELSEKLNKKFSECQSLESELADLRGVLRTSELQVQQLTQGGNIENSSQAEEFHHQKLQLQKKISLHEQSIEKLITERDQMADEYQLYIQQLSQQVTSLRDELKQGSNEKESLVKEKQALTEKLEALEAAEVPLQTNSDELRLEITVLENKNEELSKELQTQVSDNKQMSNLVMEQESRISDLETTLERLKEQEVDKTRIMETMQSDKVAASRAVAQNRELKRQLTELQNGFVTMSNNKLDLTEKLLAEQHITKELGERLSQQEEELRELKEQLATKEEQVQTMELSKTKGMYQQTQIADRMRHYEAQGQLAEMLQQELNQAKERINMLVNQNTELRMVLARQVETTISVDGSSEDKDTEKRNNLVASLSTSVRQLEMERDQMMKQMEEQKLYRVRLEEQIKNKETQLLEGPEEEDENKVSKQEYEGMKTAMSQLEERFKQTMDEIAELSDEKQQLEHLVLQLQGETETIGDYISLYQIQRGLMRKRASEKDEYIAQLARDREDLKTKLAELQDLVIRLFEEKKQYQKQGLIVTENALDQTTCEHSFDNANVIVEEQNLSPPCDITDSCGHVINNGDTGNTAQKIMDLLTEIGTTNLIEKPVTDNFHPCPVCSGRLITV